MSKESPFPPNFDPSNKFGAGLIADHIMLVWAQRGHANVFAERYQEPGFIVWFVRSNLVNGMPPARTETRGGSRYNKRVLMPRVAA